MPIESRISWDQYFITIAYTIAMKSKDPSTKVGAVIVGPDKEIRATGYNGFPRNLEDREEDYQNSQVKYQLVNHAEENAILHCARIGVPSKGCTIYVPWVPCSNCAKLIIQAGITEVVYHAQFPGNSSCACQQEGCKPCNWTQKMDTTRAMLEKTGVTLKGFSGTISFPGAFYNQQDYPFSTL